MLEVSLLDELPGSPRPALAVPASAPASSPRLVGPTSGPSGGDR